MIRYKQVQREYVAWSALICIWYRYNICIWCFSNNKQIMSWSDIAYGIIFITMCLRFYLQKHSPRICQILWRINELKIWYANKRWVLLCKTCSNTKMWLPTTISHTHKQSKHFVFFSQDVRGVLRAFSNLKIKYINSC